MPPSETPAIPHPVAIHKSKSCPADFTSDHLTPPMPATTPPVSTGSPIPRLKRPSSGSTSKRFSHGVKNGSSMTSPTSIANGGANNGQPEKPLPGRPRRRGNRSSFTTGLIGKTKKDPAQSIRYRFMTSRWMKNPMRETAHNSYASLAFAVFLWYSLGVISITTSNLLMMDKEPSHTNTMTRHIGGVPPLLLTLQQLVIGTTMLRFLLRMRFLGSPGIQPWPSSAAAAAQAAQSQRKNLLFNTHNNNTNNNQNKFYSLFSDLISSNLVLAGACFAMGFLATNSGFLASSAAFVETVKAAEPITSAGVAVLWRIETLSGPELLSLCCIVCGVLISTLAHTATSSSSTSSPSVIPSLLQSLQSCAVVMTANLCFSFRGLYQKLFRASPEGSAQVIDDLNLQLRMQQIGVIMLAIPVVFLDLRQVMVSLWELSWEVGLIRSGIAIRYIVLALINGIAFTSYNLASTFILTRISVVHHAALNCIRRIFAIIVTSIYFRIPVTVMGIMGFFVSFGGFMSFTHHKIKRQKQPKPVSSLLPVSHAASNNKAEV